MSTPEGSSKFCWRVFPWDPRASAGSPFSASYAPPPTGRGRFDLPRTLSRVLYVGESPDHAVAESLHPWRGRRLEPFHLVRAGLPLAMARVEISPGVTGKLADLCSPATLASLGVAPDETASRHRDTTQPIAATAWAHGRSGLRWWSSFWGDWHTVVLFVARTGRGVRFGTPEILTLESEAVAGAAGLLDMRT